ncbi:MAG: hypothetical protein CSA95_03595 [Bacteroidetes bacterium]|nr:MAG: hypothetical protein CSA95_03595 [Bacteroidota bacterium]
MNLFHSLRHGMERRYAAVSLSYFKPLVAMVLFMTWVGWAEAQTSEDALRYSTLSYGVSTARSQAMAGAFGALGADLSTLSTNPAGIAVYKRSVVSFTPSLYVGEVTSSYQGSQSHDNKYNFNIGSAGFVVVGKRRKNEALRNFQFGFGVNRTNNFHNRMLAEGFNRESSIRTMWGDYANTEGSLNPFDTELAVNTGLLFYDSVSGQYLHDVTYGGLHEGYVAQQKFVVTSGSMNEVVFSTGLNLYDKLYVGATLGLPYLRYSSSATFVEDDIHDSIPYFSALSYKEELTTSGGGFNFKLGVIYKPVYWLRLGGAIHTPTFFNGMSDEWSSELAAFYDRNQNEVENATALASGSYDYALQTPMRLMGSVAVVIGKVGLISGEYAYVDYAKAKFRSEDNGFYNVNKTIANSYRVGHNVKVGTEWMVMPLVKVRAGYAYFGSPYLSEVNSGGKRQMVSFGLGFGDQDFFANLAFSHYFFEREYYMYSSEYTQPVQNKYISNQALLTLGFRF